MAVLPLTSLQDDVAALGCAVEQVSGPVVLTAHAYAGAVIGGAPAGPVEAFVRVAAPGSDEGGTVADVFHRATPTRRRRPRPGTATA